MWLQLDRISEDELAYLEGLGRALALAQNFESQCKDILIWIELAIGVEEGRLKNLDDMREASEVLVNRLLGAAVRRFGSISKIKPQDLTVLIAAKDARNFIAHEAATAVPLKTAPGSLSEVVQRLRREVEALASGDNLVSRWAYEFHEQHQAPFTVSHAYPAAAADWVMTPLRQIETAV